MQIYREVKDKIYFESEKKYKAELLHVKKYIENDVIYDMFVRYRFKIGTNDYIQLSSNINIYEACFISLVFQTYLSRQTPKVLNVCEIGLAYGTSSMIILNEIIKSGLHSNYRILDPNQTIQWKSIGHNNVKRFKHTFDTKNKVDYKLIEGLSNVEAPKLDDEYDIVFIDGSHATDVVMEDMVNADRLLKNQGIMILDDVQHKEVRVAIEWFMKNYPQYKKVHVDSSNYPTKLKFIENAKVYDETDSKNFERSKKRPNNPLTMFALMKDTDYDEYENILHNVVSVHLPDAVIENKDKFIGSALLLLDKMKEDDDELTQFYQLKKHFKTKTRNISYLDYFKIYFNETRKLDCIGNVNSIPSIILCINYIIESISNMEKIFLEYDFRALRYNQEDGFFTIGEEGVYANLCLFCLHSFMFINLLINIHIYIGYINYLIDNENLNTEMNDKYKKLNGLMNRYVIKDIVPSLYENIKKIIDIIVNKSDYSYTGMFVYKNNTSSSPHVNKNKEFMKKKKDKIKITWNTSEFEKELNNLKTEVHGKTRRIKPPPKNRPRNKGLTINKGPTRKRMPLPPPSQRVRSLIVK